MKKYNVDMVVANNLETYSDHVVLISKSEGVALKDIQIHMSPASSGEVAGDETSEIKVDGIRDTHIHRQGEDIEPELVESIMRKHQEYIDISQTQTMNRPRPSL